MVTKKREILIKLEETEELSRLVNEIRKLEETIKEQFEQYEEISQEEDEIFENWWYYLEEISHNLEHITL